MGGEEFAVVLMGVDSVAGREICERIRTQLAGSTTLSVDGRPIEVTASVGFTIVEPQVDRKTLFAAADKALYDAKRTGRNRLALAA